MLALTQRQRGAFWLQEPIMGLRMGMKLGLDRSLKLSMILIFWWKLRLRLF
jgi:hypothetical protein